MRGCTQALPSITLGGVLIPFSLSNSEGSERISLEAGAVNDDKERRVDRFDLRAHPSTAKLDI